ncbi:acylneuraminate cytidylyltransferase family protein [Candidatus Viridilinea mediisalina]|uniref:CMP-N-acetylneuraminic acid synthetase n=1 Tax=Candidatus Viridilinea mediisalina TaxID=2024553 RepID=A0A2A6RM59_9CHLR|nr:acylneuraminate cytidylyltransferase family protein [Candidatus Viridilinea mediisalina]PDW04023.1 CMP-N-acetylneuraminic acid synthetase [Candidatus Viridilinea mediisalina]
MKILALIPARAGSKRLPQKNIMLLAGKPLIFWSVKVALQSPIIDRVIVSTDSSEIAQIARNAGAEVPFLRPAELAADHTADFPVFEHALVWLEQHEAYTPDLVAWLRPTSPLRTVEDLASAFDTLLRTGADSVRSVVEVEHHPYWMKWIEQECLVPFLSSKDETVYYQHQLLPPVYRLNGAVDITWVAQARLHDTLFGKTVAAYVMPRERSIDIDTIMDLKIAELLMQERGD